MCARRGWADTALARIVEMVRDAQLAKPAIQRLADKIARVFVPVIVGVALVAGLVWMALAACDGVASGDGDPCDRLPVRDGVSGADCGDGGDRAGGSPGAFDPLGAGVGGRAARQHGSL